MTGKIVGVIGADVVNDLHIFPGAGLIFRPVAAAVPVHGEGVEALAAQIQQLAQLLVLLPE